MIEILLSVIGLIGAYITIGVIVVIALGRICKITVASRPEDYTNAVMLWWVILLVAVFEWFVTNFGKLMQKLADGHKINKKETENDN